MTSSPVEFPAPQPVAVDQPPPRVSREYHHALRQPGVRWWRGALAMVILIVGYLLIGAVLGIGASMIDVARGASSVDDLAAGNIALSPVTLLAVNLNAAAMIPLGMLVQRWLFGVRGGQLSSVRGLFRWRLLGKIALVIVPVWIIYVVAGLFIGMPGQPPMEAINLSIAMLVVVLTTTWAQSAGEEYLFRGILTRSIGSWFASPRVAFVIATVGANLLFMAAHLATDPWLIAYYFVFGVCCSFIVRRTGGLEATALLHAVNNIVFFLATVLFTGDKISMDRSVGSGGPFMILPMAMLILAAVGIELWGRRARLDRFTDEVQPAAVIEQAQPGRVTDPV